MKILKVDAKSKTLKIVPETKDDLWHLERVIEKGDLVSGSTDRKIKAEEGRDAKRVRIFVKIEVESVEFHETTGNLRINGIILGGKPEEFIEIKAHQSIDVKTGKDIEIVKHIWGKHHVERLEKAKKATHKSPVLLIAMDDESASFAVMKEFKMEPRAVINADKKGKMFEEDLGAEENYFRQVFEKIQEYEPEEVVIAGPGFTRNKFGKYVEGKKFDGKIFYESCNSVGITGLNELLKTGILDKIVEETQISKEAKLVEKVFEELGKDTKLVVYGIEEIKNAVAMHAVSELLVLDKVLIGKRDELEEIMKNAELGKANVNIISSDNEAGKKLESITGIAAILRFRIN